MQQAFVSRNDLNRTGDDPIPVVAFYEASVDISSDAHGEGMTVITVPSDAIESGTPGIGPVLAPGWRDKYRAEVAGGEASRRILEVFPDHSQRNSSAEYSNYITLHGADTSRWPQAAQLRRAEIERAWTYVNAVRTANAKLVTSTLPRDPTANGHWPARIAPYRPL